MQEINITQLPTYTPWVRRLLGLDGFAQVTRGVEKTESEYNQDKYFRCLQYYADRPTCSFEDVKATELGGPPDQVTCISRGERLYASIRKAAFDEYYKLIIDTIAQSMSGFHSVVELGCGYGYNLHLVRERYPAVQLIGGEYSANAVELARRLFVDDPRTRVSRFNFFDGDYALLRSVTEPALIFTVYAIHQLPSADGVVSKIVDSGVKGAVLHFEPVYEHLNSGTTLGLLRQRYTQVNDYNRDLRATLEAAHVNITHCEPDVFGINPLHPMSVISWQCG